MDQGAVRNLEQIQEVDAGSRAGRAFALALVALGGAAVVFAAVALNGRKSASVVAVDPLSELVAQKTKGAPPKPDLSPQDVTFPGILSDRESPTTALAAIRGAGSQVARRSNEPVTIAGEGREPSTTLPLAPGAPSTVDAEPPPAGDRLPVVPLPAKAVLDPSPVVTRPRDALTKAAAESAAQPPSGPMAPAGREGGYQLQISSFRNPVEANAFAEQLRARGHKAYVSEAVVAGRGKWHRVRVGPFPSQQAAASYRISFEQKEHVVPFVVTPKSK